MESVIYNREVSVSFKCSTGLFTSKRVTVWHLHKWQRILLDLVEMLGLSG